MILKYFLPLALVCGICKARFLYDSYNDDGNEGSIFDIDVLMPSVHPTQDDQYICASQPAIDELYIVNFIPKASMKFVHHMLLFGCESVHHSYLEGYNRGCTYGECTAGRAIMFAWARDADSPVIPPDVGFHIGGDSGVNYLTLQIHYATAAPFADGSTDSSGLTLVATTEEQKYMGGIFLNVGMNIHVYPNSPNSHTDVACEYKDTVPIYAFGFRTHAHSLGKVITGFRIRNNKWEEIAQGNPQWPQAFYPMDEIYQIQRGDVIATRCTFDGTRTDHEVHVGSKHTDEMCNLYIMYYTDSALGESFKVCSQQASRDLFSHVPLGWDTDTPPAKMPSSDGGDTTEPESDDDDDINMLEDKLKTDVQDQIQRIGGNDDDGDSSHDDQHEGNEETGKATTAVSSPKDEEEEGEEEQEEEEDPSGARVLNEVPNWVAAGLALGQVGGLDTDSQDNVKVFHRGDRKWEVDSFDRTFHYLKLNDGPIKNDTVLTLDKETGKVISKWGANQFYIPHGLFVDHEGNIWLTDVALHQVFKYPADGVGAPSLTLGVRLIPGSDKSHFCQPADVVVDPTTGNFFVADGYCNTRIVKFSPKGEFLFAIDHGAIGHLTPSSMFVVHSVTLANNNQHVCAADRENGRVLCFDSATGQFIKQIKPKEFDARIFSAVYSPKRGGVLFVINGPTFPQKQILGVTVNYDTGEALETWSPEQGFVMPHTMAVSSDANDVYVGEIGPNRIWKFVDPVPPKSNQDQSHTNNIQLARDSLLSHDEESAVSKTAAQKDTGATMVIVTVLAVPILLMMVIAVVVRLHAQGKLSSGRGMFVVGGSRGRKYANGDTFSIGNFFNKKKGFRQVSTDDSDQEGTTWSEESDVEEYSILNSKPTQNL